MGYLGCSGYGSSDGATGLRVERRRRNENQKRQNMRREEERERGREGEKERTREQENKKVLCMQQSSAMMHPHCGAAERRKISQLHDPMPPNWHWRFKLMMKNALSQ
ncbi:hypothetical protein ACMFMG_008615 [Clarireedia jacksonii]